MKNEDFGLQREIPLFVTKGLHLKLVNTLLLCICSSKYNLSF